MSRRTKKQKKNAKRVVAKVKNKVVTEKKEVDYLKADLTKSFSLTMLGLGVIVAIKLLLNR